ncbi:CrcB protein [Actinomycetospora succinea]|uniref:Fluoride-specific ion channel FluC n=1 Tax=Actinomycetospora succinea TaxID=663603 RepID=A0A4R6UZ79_9PSEU|nr:CrcB family protein [Actinomycetospora succinea]TDQ52866.1 CrcB protein [Actinomycetospora succinea]
MTVLLIALGAAVGAPTRYLTDRWLQSTRGTGFPWGTFTVNVAASFVLGLVLGGPAPHAVVLAVGVGFCGSLSTWSTLAYETVRLTHERARTASVMNVVASTLAGLGAAGLGLALSTVLWR